MYLISAWTRANTSLWGFFLVLGHWFLCSKTKGHKNPQEDFHLAKHALFSRYFSFLPSWMLPRKIWILPLLEVAPALIEPSLQLPLGGSMLLHWLHWTPHQLLLSSQPDLSLSFYVKQYLTCDRAVLKSVFQKPSSLKEIADRPTVILSFCVRTETFWERRMLREKEMQGEIIMGSKEWKGCEGSNMDGKGGGHQAEHFWEHPLSPEDIWGAGDHCLTVPHLDMQMVEGGKLARPEGILGVVHSLSLLLPGQDLMVGQTRENQQASVAITPLWGKGILFAVC